MRKIINIEKKKIGIKQPVFLIAEVGSNHNRDKNTVKKLIDCAAKAGFDAVKFQIYDAKEAFSANETTKDVKLDHLYGLKPWWEVARDRILMPREWFGEMFSYVRKKNKPIFIEFDTMRTCGHVGPEDDDIEHNYRKKDC